MKNEKLDIAISDTQFRTQMTLLKRVGYRFVTISELAKLQQSNTRGRFAAITFDDGSTDILLHALPILSEMNAVATVFAIAGSAATKSFFDWDLAAAKRSVMTLQEEDRAMSWSEYRTLVNNGWEIGSHTVTHPMLTEVLVDEAEAQIIESKSILESCLGVPVTSFCYPAGHANLEVARLVEANGYDCAVITHNSLPLPNGLVRPIYRNFSINRIGIYWYDTTPRFIDKLVGFYELRQNSKILLTLAALLRRLLGGMGKTVKTQSMESGKC